MVLRLIVAAITFSCAVAHADNNFSNTEAGAISIVSSMAQGGLAYASKNISTFLSVRAVSKPLVAQALTDADIKTIVAINEGTLGPRFGIGQAGGSEIEVVYDAGRVERVAGGLPAAGKPEMTSEYVYPRIEGSARDLEAKLTALKDSGAVISKVEVRSLLKRYAMKSVSGVLTVYFVANTASNVYRAYDFSQKAWHSSTANADLVSKCKGTDSPDCNATGLNSYKWLWSSADAVFYTFHANQ